jgi:prolyl-tRNA synthetase
MIAPIQAVLATIYANDEEKEVVVNKAKSLSDALKAEGIRVKIDARDERPGVKFFEWEKKGVPVRLEIGPKDVAKNQVVAVRRDNGEKEIIADLAVPARISEILESIQESLFESALDSRLDNTKEINDYGKFKKQMEEKDIFVAAHWCGNAACEEKIKEETKATIRCIPLDQKKEKGKCLLCGKESEGRVIFAKAY